MQAFLSPLRRPCHPSLPPPPSTSLHPAGFILLLGFKDCVRVHNVQYRGLPIFRELPFKHCRVLAFSHGGHLFAAAFGIAITVFDTHTLQQRHSFTGERGRGRVVCSGEKACRPSLTVAHGRHQGTLARSLVWCGPKTTAHSRRSGKTEPCTGGGSRCEAPAGEGLGWFPRPSAPPLA